MTNRARVVLGDDARQRGLARARRTPEDHRRDAIALDGVAEEASLAEELFEPDDVFERARTEALREGRVGLRRRVEGVVSKRVIRS